MSAVANLRTYARYITGLPGFLRSTITLDEAIEILRRRREDRERAFLQLAKCGIYDNPSSPYLALLKTAGCELGDLRNLVRQRGLEGALRVLADGGVYLSQYTLIGYQCYGVMEALGSVHARPSAH